MQYPRPDEPSLKPDLDILQPGDYGDDEDEEDEEEEDDGQETIPDYWEPL